MLKRTKSTFEETASALQNILTQSIRGESQPIHFLSAPRSDSNPSFIFFPDLWWWLSHLEENSALVVVKGDANYRRVLGDRPWPLDAPFKSVARCVCVRPSDWKGKIASHPSHCTGPATAKTKPPSKTKGHNPVGSSSQKMMAFHTTDDSDSQRYTVVKLRVRAF